MSKGIFEKHEGVDFELSEKEIEDLKTDIGNLMNHYMDNTCGVFWNGNGLLRSDITSLLQLMMEDTYNHANRVRKQKFSSSIRNLKLKILPKSIGKIYNNVKSRRNPKQFLMDFIISLDDSSNK